MTILFSFNCYGDHPDLHSFPTRRSSDLGRSSRRPASSHRAPGRRATAKSAKRVRGFVNSFLPNAVGRSEEHTSELQSHSDLVCRLLLEKKKPFIAFALSYGSLPSTRALT